jgi:hypothetical protein
LHLYWRAFVSHFFHVVGPCRVRQPLNDFELLGAALFTFFVKGADF